MSVKFSLNELVMFLTETGEDPLIDGNRNYNIDITGFSSIYETRQGTLSWISDRANVNWELLTSSVMLCSTECSPPDDFSQIVVRVGNPRRAFAKTIQHFYQPRTKVGIESTAIIGANCSLGNEIYIGHHVIIGDNVVIGNETVIRENVSIYSDSCIGNNCIIHSGVVIGADGFGYERENDGQLIKFPQIGRVKIGDRVEIGANSCIDRGALTDTNIGDDTKVDNLVHIAHGVKIGQRCLVVALAMLGGSAVVEDDVFIGPSAAIRDGIHIGERVSVSMGSVVTHDVPPGSKVTGNFAIEHGRFINFIKNIP
jgi:UDP-3-O-[3-hydroxymyristoyl] glucosamine N-acyltransferase